MKLGFAKMQGLGNDFVVLDGPLELTDDQVQRLCDRRYGIGGDGVLVVTPGDPIAMEYWNADGSAAEMCGNGLRCVARFAVDRGLAPAPSFDVATPIGIRRVSVSEHGIEADLGPVTVSGHTNIDDVRYHLIDVGNPHAVSVVDDPSVIDVAGVGRRVETDPQFAMGTNVEFVAIADGSVTMRVWERGVGETRACGTGMAAAAMVAAKLGRSDGPIEVHVPGGAGVVEFRDGRGWLRGPAEYAFTGTVEI